MNIFRPCISLISRQIPYIGTTMLRQHINSVTFSTLQKLLGKIAVKLHSLTWFGRIRTKLNKMNPRSFETLTGVMVMSNYEWYSDIKGSVMLEMHCSKYNTANWESAWNWTLHQNIKWTVFTVVQNLKKQMGVAPVL